MSLFDQFPSPTGDDLRDQALADVETNADPAWLAKAEQVIRSIPGGWTFTTDDVWFRLGEIGVGAPREPRAMGAAITAAAKAGLIVNGGQYRKSERPQAHARPIPIWVRTR